MCHPSYLLIMFLRLLVFGSGLPGAEKPTAKRQYLLTFGPDAKEENAAAWQKHKEYVKKTSILLPLPRRVYSRLPNYIKGKSSVHTLTINPERC